MPPEAHANRNTRRAVALLIHAAAPEHRHVVLGTLWLVAAALLEALGPLLGKYFIDQYLVPKKIVLTDMALLLGATLVAGAVASVIRYAQLTRLAGVAMRSVRRLREEVYGHVLRLPMAFFDKAITGQLVSRVTNDTEQVKSLYVQVLFGHGLAGLALDADCADTGPGGGGDCVVLPTLERTGGGAGAAKTQ